MDSADAPLLSLTSSPWVSLVSASIVSLVAGWYAGHYTATRSANWRRFEEDSDSDVSDESSGSEDEDSDDDTGVPAGELKMVLIVRNDLKMGKGKVAAQCSHATLGVYRICKRREGWAKYVKAWQRRGQAKIALKVDNEDAMNEVAEVCAEAGLATYIVEDAGRTQIPRGSRTVLAVGPAPVAQIDRITGRNGTHALKLLH